MGKMKRFWCGTLPAHLAPGFQKILRRETERILKIVLPVVSAMEIFNLARIFLGPNGGFTTMARCIYFGMYTLLLTATVGTGAVLWLLSRSRDESVRNKRTLGLAAVYAAIICVWAVAITVYDQRVTENVTVYVSIILPVAVLFSLKPWQALAIFGSSQVGLILMFPTFQTEPVNNMGNYINTTIIAFMAVVVSFFRYHSKLKEYRHRATITRQTQEIHRINQRLTVLALTDNLTGLYNRRYLDEILPERWERAWLQKEQVCCFMLDIDDFKAYNDARGHLAGDECIRFIADEIRRHTQPEQDCLIRYGGEEFLVILFGRGEAELKWICEEIRAGVESWMLLQEEPVVPVTVSIGGCACGKSSVLKDWIHCADRALYRAKSSGKNTTAIGYGNCPD